MNKAMLPVATVVGLMIAGCGPNDGLKQLSEAREAMERADFKNAITLLEDSLRNAPDNVDAMVTMAQAQLAIGNITSAGAAIKRAMTTNRDDLDVRYLAAQIAWHDKRYADASELYREIANDAKLESVDRSRGWVGLGIVHMTQGESHLARVAFLTAIRLDRRNAAAWYHLGLVYRDSPFGYNEAALEQFNVYVRLDVEASPRVQKTQRNLIPALKETIARSMMDRTGVAKRDSAACATEIAAAEAAWKKNQFKTALKRYEAARSADSLSFAAALGMAKALLKTDSSNLGQQKALEAYAAACSLNASSVSTLLAAGNLAVKQGFNAQAVDFYSRAVAANPSSLDAIDGLIRSLRKIRGKSSIANAYQRYRDILPRRGK